VKLARQPGRARRVRSVLLAAALAAGLTAAQVWARNEARRTLVVCADPNNLPFSDRAGHGFENELAKLLARDMHARIEYVWWAQRRGYVRHTLDEARCDVWPGVARGVERISTTQPYYRSTYVFVARADKHLDRLSLDDPRLRSLVIGVQMIGDNAMNTPPAQALAARGITSNVRGYMLYGDYGRANPPAAIVEAVAKGDIDVALVWGPLAGYFAQRSRVALQLTPVSAQDPATENAMVYDVSMGVRSDRPALFTEICADLEKDKPAIDALLHRFHVPQSSASAFNSASVRQITATGATN
jgi:mxaJ protein